MALHDATTEACCAHALSLESADDSEAVTLRCAVHHSEAQVGFGDDEYAQRIDSWFADHAMCTRVVPAQRVA